MLADYRYTLASNGQRSQVEESDAQGVVRTVVYTYDDLSRLTGEQITHRDSSKSRTTSYTYDNVGNRLTKVVGSTSTSYAYDDNDRLLTETTGTTVIAYSYDASGNTTRKESKTGGVTTAIVTYAYDVENHLLEARQGTSDSALMLAVRYVYDADGNRVKTTASGVTTTHLVDTNRPYAEVLEEVATAMTSTSRTSYVHGDDLISQVRSIGTPAATTVSYFHQDGLGSTRVLTNDAGTVADTYSYEAFGTLTESTGSTPNTHLFTGEPRDPATGFYYLRARWMDPAVGRFVTKDTFQGMANDPLSLHKYLYVKANPTNFTDPSGNLTLGEFAASFSVEAVFARAAVGSIIGGIDAMLKGQNYASGAMAGAIGGGIAPIIPLRWGFALATAGILHSIANGQYAAAFFEVATAGSGFLFTLRGFPTRADFLAVFGRAGAGRQWHHIVEEGNAPAGVASTTIHHPHNLVNIPESMHTKISAFYSSKQGEITGPGFSRLRDWLRTRPFDEQYAFGLWAMAKLASPNLQSLQANAMGMGISWAWETATVEPFAGQND